jgi:hypothetical protein
VFVVRAPARNKTQENASYLTSIRQVVQRAYHLMETAVFALRFSLMRRRTHKSIPRGHTAGRSAGPTVRMRQILKHRGCFGRVYVRGLSRLYTDIFRIDAAHMYRQSYDGAIRLEALLPAQKIRLEPAAQLGRTLRLWRYSSTSFRVAPR